MPERSFGRTVRYRRTKLGLSQAKLGELVGRSTATVRAWERDSSRPTDPKVLAALSAVLGVDEKHLFDKVGASHPEVETSPTVEQALATLWPETHRSEGDDPGKEAAAAVDPEPVRERELVGAGVDSPAYVEPSEPFVQTPPTPSVVDLSYVEDSSQRQVYRVRTLATLVAAVILAIALVWAVSEGIEALGSWWNEFFANLNV
jgi:transcriptional regulator with XRE-family HTH domain